MRYPRLMNNDNVSFVNITDDEILAALFGETVTIDGPRFQHFLKFDAVTGKFEAEMPFGVLTCDEANLRLVRWL